MIFSFPIRVEVGCVRDQCQKEKKREVPVIYDVLFLLLYKLSYKNHKCLKVLCQKRTLNAFCRQHGNTFEILKPQEEPGLKC